MPDLSREHQDPYSPATQNGQTSHHLTRSGRSTGALTDLAGLLAKQSIPARTDAATRLLYSTDASIYQIEPLGVVFPRRRKELETTVELALGLGIPVLARGAGSSLAGQAIGEALIIDCSRHLDRILEINPEEGFARVEPGVVLANLNKTARAYGLQFGPDPASAERATMGGSLANNATGAHSIRYGMSADHLLSAEVILGDGRRTTFESLSLAEAQRRANRDSGVEAGLYRAALDVRARYAEAICEHWPRTWRRASGYNLEYLLPWAPLSPADWYAPDQPYPPIEPGEINLAALFAGSEGTLAVLSEANVRLVPLPRHTVLGVLAYPTLGAACDAAPGLLAHRPSAVELIPNSLIRLARNVPAYAAQLAWVDELPSGSDPGALLVVEFAGEHPGRLLEQARALDANVWIAETAQSQRYVWNLRKVGLGILQSRPGDSLSTAFIEDLTVPVEHLGAFVAELERIFAEYGVEADFYGHASVGCLHIRPVLPMKTAEGVRAMRQIAAETVAATLRYGGAVSGEHGDGIARSEWHHQMFGDEVMAAFSEIKQAADPRNLLNPGKILDAPPMDTHLRYGPAYRARAWTPVMDFRSAGGAPGAAGLAGAVEMCNGAGVCRKDDGLMCPSFQATRDEMHATRGRANLLRAMISGVFPAEGDGSPSYEAAVKQALDLCLACKGCKAECPSGVDVARLKYEFNAHYYRTHSRAVRDYLFAYIDRVARLGSPMAGLVNAVTGSRLFKRTLGAWSGLAPERSLPRMASRPLSARLGDDVLGPVDGEDVLLLSDAFTQYYHPEAGQAVVELLARTGCRVHLLPVLGAGRTLISKGFLEAAQRHAAGLVSAVRRLDPEGGMPLVGVEPSEIYTLLDELPDLLPGDDYAAGLVGRAWMPDEFLLRPGPGGAPRIESLFNRQAGDGGLVLLHGHCYQKARPPAPDGLAAGVAATRLALEAAGYRVEEVDSGCCGMAGAFGYEAEHFAVSQQVGELKLLPAVRAADEGTLIAAAGVSCQAQIEDGSGRLALHPAQLLSRVLG